MKKQRSNRWSSLLCGIAFCMAALLAAPTLRSYAAPKAPSCPKTQTVYFEKSNMNGESHFGWTSGNDIIFIKNLSPSAKITNVKSSNKIVHAVKSEFYPSSGKKRPMGVLVEYQHSEWPDEPQNGTKSKISFKVKQNGKTYPLSCTVTFKQHPATIKSLIIDGKNYASKATGYWNREIKLPHKKVKISVKLKPGMRLESITHWHKGKSKKIKNGGTVNLKKGDMISISCPYTKSPKYYSAAPAYIRNTSGYLSHQFDIMVK